MTDGQVRMLSGLIYIRAEDLIKYALGCRRGIHALNDEAEGEKVPKVVTAGAKSVLHHITYLARITFSHLQKESEGSSSIVLSCSSISSNANKLGAQTT